mgnify:CR=1 FL=1
MCILRALTDSLETITLSNPMATYTAPRKDILFTLHDVLGIEQLSKMSGYEDATPEIFDGVVDEAAKFIEGVLAPLAKSGDEQGCRWEKDGAWGKVQVPDGYVDAYKQFQEAGWVGLANPVEFGGQGLRVSVQ